MNYPIDYKEEQRKFYKQLYDTANTLEFKNWYEQVTYPKGPLEQKEMFTISVNKCQWEVMKDSWISYGEDMNTIYQSWTGLPNSWGKIKKRF